MDAYDKLVQVLIDCNKNMDRILARMDEREQLREQRMKMHDLSPQERLLLHGIMADRQSDDPEKPANPNQ